MLFSIGGLRRVVAWYVEEGGLVGAGEEGGCLLTHCRGGMGAFLRAGGLLLDELREKEEQQ